MAAAAPTSLNDMLQNTDAGFSETLLKLIDRIGKKDADIYKKANMRELTKRYPRAGYGGRFRWWLTASDPQSYNSWGNGSAMRVSSAA